MSGQMMNKNEAFRTPSVSLGGVCHFVQFLIVGVLCGPGGALVWLAFLGAARMLDRYVDKASPEERGAGDRLLSVLALAMCTLSPSAMAPGLTLALAMTLFGIQLTAPRPYSWISSRPLGGTLAAALFISAYLRGQGELANAILVFVGICFLAFKLYEARANLQRADLNAELMAQSLRDSETQAMAIWSLDFRTRSMQGGDQFSTLLGEPLTFERVGEMLSARDEERSLISDVFAPGLGRTRQIYITHDARARDGRNVQLAHCAILHAGLMGEPLSLYCITSCVEGALTRLSLPEQWSALRAQYDLAAEAPRLDEKAPASLKQERRARA